jgi:hypothetical protein
MCGAALLALGGCGGCQTEAPPPASQPAQQSAPAAGDARTPAPAAAAPPAEQVPAEPPAEEPDCFVIVDAEPDYGGPPLTVQFETEVDCTGSPVTYEWDFGDGEKGPNEAHPKHVYAKPGEYIATVRVAAPDGGRSDDEIDITVDELFHE